MSGVDHDDWAAQNRARRAREDEKERVRLAAEKAAKEARREARRLAREAEDAAAAAAIQHRWRAVQRHRAEEVARERARVAAEAAARQQVLDDKAAALAAEKARAWDEAQTAEAREAAALEAARLQRELEAEQLLERMSEAARRDAVERQRRQEEEQRRREAEARRREAMAPQPFKFETDYHCLLFVGLQAHYAAVFGVDAGVVGPHGELELFESNVTRLVKAARRVRCPIYHVRQVDEPGQSRWMPWSEALAGGVRPAALADGEPFAFGGTEDGDVVLTKSGPDAFFETDLEVRLRGAGVRHLYLCGLETGGAILSTAFSAFARGFQVTLIANCCADRNRARHQSVVRHFGKCVPSAGVGLQAGGRYSAAEGGVAAEAARAGGAPAAPAAAAGAAGAPAAAEGAGAGAAGAAGQPAPRTKEERREAARVAAREAAGEAAGEAASAAPAAAEGAGAGGELFIAERMLSMEEVKTLELRLEQLENWNGDDATLSPIKTRRETEDECGEVMSAVMLDPEVRYLVEMSQNLQMQPKPQVPSPNGTPRQWSQSIEERLPIHEAPETRDGRGFPVYEEGTRLMPVSQRLVPAVARGPPGTPMRQLIPPRRTILDASF